MTTPLPPGRFHALGAESTKFPFTAADLTTLAAGRTLTSEDQGILNEIITALAEGSLPFSWGAYNNAFIRQNDRSRWLDYVIYRFKFDVYPRRHVVADFPIYLLIEPTSACNLRCVMCFQSDKTFTKAPFMGVMDIGLFRDVIDQAVEGGTRAITLASRGEPTMHRHLGKMLDYISGKFFEVKLNTNATRMTDELSRTILATGVNQLVFSVDAHEKELYEAIRLRGKFDQVLANVQRFEQIRAEEFPESTLSTRISGVYLDEKQEKGGFRAFWENICDEVGYVQALTRWNTYENDPHPDLSHACHYLWERLYVWFDGTCNPCDADYKSFLSPGNVRDTSLRDIWHGEGLTKLRRQHTEGRRIERVPCDRCGI